MFYVVPNDLSDEIYRRIDEQIALVPGAAADREFFYRALLDHFNEHGVIPGFSLVRKDAAEAIGRA
jgi:hypothetical protein